MSKDYLDNKFGIVADRSKMSDIYLGEFSVGEDYLEFNFLNLN